MQKPTSKPVPPSIREFMHHLQVERGISKASQDAYQRDLLQLAEYCQINQFPFPTIGCETINSFVDSLRNHGLRPNSIARKISAIKTFYSYMIQEKHVEENPCRMLQAPKFNKRFKSALPLDEMQQLIHATEQEGNDALRLRDQAMIELMYAAGLRVSELLQLRPGDIDFQNQYLRTMGKGKKERLVPFHDEALRKLIEYVEHARPVLVKQNHTETLFVNRNGNKMSRMGFWKVLKKYALSAGIKTKLSPHIMRHSYATHLLANGVDLRVLQEMLGHSSITTTELYTHLDEQQMIGMHAKFHPRNKKM